MPLAAAPVILTPRLVLRPLTLRDSSEIQALVPHWHVVALMSATIPWPYPEDGALTFIRDIALPAMVAGRQWHWSLRRRAAPDQLIGAISLIDSEDDNWGFWLDPAWQRRGFMTEACAGVADFWFDTLGFPVLREPKAIANAASRRVSEKSGMRVIRREQRAYVSGPLPGEIWEITVDEWRTRTSKS